MKRYGHTFIHQYNESAPRLVMKVHEESDIHEVMETFEHYLLAVGFAKETVEAGFEGRLELSQVSKKEIQ